MKSVKKKEKDLPLNQAVVDSEAKYQSQFDGAIRRSIAQITKRLLKM